MATSVPELSAAKLSVIVPFFDAPENLERCLAALRVSTVDFQLILVDDCSNDARASAIAKAGATKYVRLSSNSGPAVARNAGVRVATGDLLVFIDSDVVVRPDTLKRIRAAFVDEPQIGALFGSYDDTPASRGLVTEYRNLVHHHYHQTGPRSATTFWAGCGAVRREVFRAAGGFDESYRRPSIEDIELGMRMHAAGVEIRLCPEIQCTHLKRWGFKEMVVVDVTRRAVPWTRLLIERPGTGGDLNLQASQKLCVVLVFLALLAVPLGFATPALRAGFVPLWAPFALLAPVLWINRALYALFLRHEGWAFAFAGVILHLFYYVYGGLAYLYAHVVQRVAPRARPAS